MSTRSEFAARIQGQIPPLLKKLAQSGRSETTGGGSARRKYTYSFSQDGLELTYKLRNNDGSYRIAFDGNVFKGDMDFVTDLTMTLEIGEFSGWVYNAEGDDDLQPLCYFFSRDVFDDTGGYAVFLDEGEYSPGDPPPFDEYNAFLATRTEP